MNKNSAGTDISELPFNIETVDNTYGNICSAEELGPGVYYIATSTAANCNFTNEYLVVMASSPAISSEAHKYGKLLPESPPVYIYSHNDYYDKGRHVVYYELHKYLMEHHIPLPETTSLQDDIESGIEVCPEYFGDFPIPANTPWGAAIRSELLLNGVLWLKTDKVGWVLAVCCPILSGLSDEAQKISEICMCEQANSHGHTSRYGFYMYRDSCLPIFELLSYYNYPLAGKVNSAALRNALLRYYPSIASAYNRDILDEKEKISFSPEIGTDFYFFS